jgi:nucleoside phosphorylase
MATTRILRHHDYTVGWVCALPLEMAVAKAMLDEIHPDLPTSSNDQNTYILGRIRAHNVVIACLPSGVYGTTSAATVAIQMLSTFKSIRFGLMVGIGGGVPRKDADIRLGDVVVSKPTGEFGGVVQYDFGKTVAQGVFERTSRLNRPPQILLTAIARLQADGMVETSRTPEFLSEMIATHPKMRAEFTYCGHEQDKLFDAESNHYGLENTCDNCEMGRLVMRPARHTHDPVIHYGLIASGNQVIKHGGTRDKLGQELGILCFEMEAAGLMDNFPCLVIRGICDYADSHKNKQWQGYAAATAAAYAKELLSVIHPNQVEETPVVIDANLQDNLKCVLNGQCTSLM